ncbi:MAG: hypothetical protein GY726_10050 [Proteobacteria bacterium]|nr:hypothetical protein [Pseudomonadota bacterium]
MTYEKSSRTRDMLGDMQGDKWGHLIESKTCEICAWSFTPKRSDAVCCNATCRSKKRRYRAFAVERLTTMADEFNCTSDELIGWYQNDMTDVARLPIADIRFIIGDYLENHKTASRNDPVFEARVHRIAQSHLSGRY